MAQKNLTIKLYVSELMYDIQNLTYLTGRSRGNGQNFEEVANMQASDDDDNKNRILRSIQANFNLLRNKLSEYLVPGSPEATEADTVLLDSSKESTLSLTLSMPSNFNSSTAETISSAAHEFIMDMAVADWFTITNKADAADYISKAQGELNNIREAISKRIRPTRTAVS